MRRSLLLRFGGGLALVLSAFPSAATAAAITVAVAANFYRPMQEIAANFSRTHHHSVRLVSGSTGRLYTQIVQGAPFDLFVAADVARPKRLETEGQIRPGSRFTYATGSLVLWSARQNLNLKRQGMAILLAPTVRIIAIANPKTAPYGAAAMQAITSVFKQKQLDRITAKLIYGESVAQAMLFAHSGNADIAILPASSIVGAKGHIYRVGAGRYRPIIQQAVVLRGAGIAAVALADYLRSSAVVPVLQKYGYGVPQ
ncbi:MAG: molybdate ABC transporter substrate-binding protein [Mariprofundales bacterium]|nr:molybdate ABC transporter substrate-binding protein [Mariprofundales bacterium]